jgi:hypothetical protein
MTLVACGDDPELESKAAPSPTTVVLEASDTDYLSTEPSGKPSIAGVKKCLEAQSLEVIGGEGAPSPGDTDAPDRGELVTRGAFIAFYSSEALADKLAGGVESSAKGAGGNFKRYGPVTVVFTDTSSQDEIETCLGA